VDEIATPDELRGMFAKAVRALRRLMKRGYFDIPKRLARRAIELRRETDSVLGFLASGRCKLSPELFVERPELYATYQGWCFAEGIKPESKPLFQQAVKNQHPEVWKSRLHGYDRWRGIGLTNSDGEFASRGKQDHEEAK
jgi:phage/plasmid-associated DNA primase